ncbi:MAG TPA: TIM barrel protein [Verrucomicrobiaceae bacterium]|jgi:hydroxypyruvate isomerase
MITRRQSVAAVLGAAIAAQTRLFSDAARTATPGVKVKHSVCRGPFSKIPLNEFCEDCKGMGIESIELLEPPDFPTILKHGLQCAMVRFTTKKLPDTHINCGWNHPEFHEVLLPGYEELIRQTADAGFKKVICMAGARRGMDEKTGLENCAAGLSKLMPLCEKLGVTMCMELLNSKVNHPDYMADHTSFGVALCEKIGSPHFRLLYDIYHMQIMEGNLCATIKENHQWLAHFHTAGVPGRHEINDTQEINYHAVLRAILETGYRDYIGQEFSPTRPDKLASLREAIEICTPSFP